jgi:hypothetical protein
MSWIERQSKAYFAYQMGRVYYLIKKDCEEFFIINTLFQNILSNSCFYLGAFVLSGYSNPLFFIVGGIVIAISLFSIVVYCQAEREIEPILGANTRVYHSRL